MHDARDNTPTRPDTHTRRRSFLAALASLAPVVALPPIALAAPADDADLIRLGREHAQAAARYRSFTVPYYSALNIPEEVREEAWLAGREAKAIAAAMAAIPARTVGDRRVKAAALLFHLQPDPDEGPDFGACESEPAEDRLAWSVARDVLAMGRA